MNRIVVFLCLVTITTLVAQPENSERGLIAAKNSLITALNSLSVDGLKESKSKFEALKGKTSEDWLVDYIIYIAYTNYHLGVLAQWTSGNNPEAIRYADEAITGLRESIKKNENFADAHALLATIYGQKIGLDQSLGATLAYEAQAAIERARTLNPSSPKAAMVAAIFTYYTPEEYGGSKSRGIDQMKQAVEFFKTQDKSDPKLLYWGIRRSALHARVDVSREWTA